MIATEFRPCIGRPYTAVPVSAKTDARELSVLPRMPGGTRERDANAPRGGSGRRALSGDGEILPEGGFLVRDLEAGEQADIRVLSGHLWVTVEGDARDYVLEAESRRSFAGPGRLMAEALEGPAEIVITEPLLRPVWQQQMPLRQS